MEKKKHLFFFAFVASFFWVLFSSFILSQLYLDADHYGEERQAFLKREVSLLLAGVPSAAQLDKLVDFYSHIEDEHLKLDGVWLSDGRSWGEVSKKDLGKSYPYMLHSFDDGKIVFEIPFGKERIYLSFENKFLENHFKTFFLGRGLIALTLLFFLVGVLYFYSHKFFFLPADNFVRQIQGRIHELFFRSRPIPATHSVDQSMGFVGLDESVDKVLQELKAVQEELEATIEASNQMLIILDESLIIRDIYHSMGVWLFSNIDEWRGRSLFDGDCPASFIASIQESILQITNRGFADRFQFYLNKEENVVYEAFVSPRFSSDAKTYMILVRDITEEIAQKKKEKELERQYHQNMKMLSIGELAGGIAHEINNPLAVIKGNIALMHKKGNLNDYSTLRLQTISEMMGRIASIVKSLSLYAEVDSEKIMELDLHDLIHDVFDLVRGAYIKENVAVVLDLDAEATLFKGNRSHMHQALLALLSNAKDALIGKSSKQIVIRTFDIQKGGIGLEIVDNGRGMTSSELDRAFDAFYSTKDIGKGRGLGLNIVQAVLEKIGGEIEIHSLPEQGTSVFVSFPLYEREALSKVSKFKERIAILAEDDSLSELTRAILEEKGYQVKVFGSKDDALGTIDHSFAMMLADFHDEDQGGVELIKALQMKGLFDLKIVLLTGESSKSIGDIADCIDAILIKPFGEEKLFDTILPLLT